MFSNRITDNKNSLPNLKKSASKLVGKILIITMLLAGFSTDATFAAEEEDIQTIYHVYWAGEYLGGLSDKSELDKLKSLKLDEAAKEFEGLSLRITTDLSIVPERVFKIGIDDSVVIEKLQKLLSVEAEAVGIEVDGERQLNVKDETAYDEVIRALKLQSVTEQELIDFEESTTDIPPLKENETRITKIDMNADLKAIEAVVPPKEVLSVDEAVKLLNKGTLEEKEYTVQKGDVLGKIANKHGMATAKLLEINPGLNDKSVIKPGEKVNITILEPLVEVKVYFESKKRETISYKKVSKNDKSLNKGDKKVTQKGSDGEKVVTEEIIKLNGKVIGKNELEKEVLVEPKDEITVVGTKVMPSRGEGSFKWPAVGGYVSSKMGTRWGRMHRGIDIARPSSRSILASDNGVVVSAGWSGAYGNRIEIDHKNGYRTLYAHLSSMDVSVGQTVSRGSKIGVMGSTGRSTGVHLHFEVTKNGSLVNPLSVLK
ncbi:M23 family metallopeptidase [Sporosarcina sp. Marseille-Q4063]|uniref:peptidoglycan DD-metalloendopeptidase family protein n=1 Tax=Sporosarcina sp. Marseille-Q4063 TaxID=2810514 RepID=UPI001BB0AE34|nr:M23 family metallopeptidase [Sporosarcina sp. Marseille-Q4063]QUW20620.1 M23 family metallopeptidase [Sporosarcina sp. Marseille-Q4063]